MRGQKGKHFEESGLGSQTGGLASIRWRSGMWLGEKARKKLVGVSETKRGEVSAKEKKLPDWPFAREERFPRPSEGKKGEKKTKKKKRNTPKRGGRDIFWIVSEECLFFTVKGGEIAL